MIRELSDPKFGRILSLTDECSEVKIALDYGIRVVYLACRDCENLFYEQPADGSDGFVTDSGWRIYGGHRLWTAPEGDWCYQPDNEPVKYCIGDDAVLILQDEDKNYHIRKSLRMIMSGEGGYTLEHIAENTGNEPVSFAVWGVNTLKTDCSAEVFFDGYTKGCPNPQRLISVWGTTDLGDPRLSFAGDRIIANTSPIDAYFKIGTYSAAGKAVLSSRGQRLEIGFEGGDALKYMKEYPDNGCNFELYMNSRFIELETLGKIKTLAPGESASHIERWKIFCQ